MRTVVATIVSAGIPAGAPPGAIDGPSGPPVLDLLARGAVSGIDARRDDVA